jgi:hypothetical protein
MCPPRPWNKWTGTARPCQPCAAGSGTLELDKYRFMFRRVIGQGSSRLLQFLAASSGFERAMFYVSCDILTRSHVVLRYMPEGRSRCRSIGSAQMFPEAVSLRDRSE